MTFTGGDNGDVFTRAYARIGHGPGSQGQRTGDITIRDAGNISFMAGTSEDAHAQIGHTSEVNGAGSFSGRIEITRAGDLSFTASNGSQAYAQIGHSSGLTVSGEKGEIALTDVGNINLQAAGNLSQIGHSRVEDADITITGAGDIALTAAAAVAKIGHLSQPNENVAGDIMIANTGDLILTADDSSSSGAQIGHGSTTAIRSNLSGVIDITTDGQLLVNEGLSSAGRGLIGHGGLSFSFNSTASDDILVRIGQSAILGPNSLIGHFVGSPSTNYTAGNTFFAVVGDLTADGTSVFNSAPTGELRFYVGGQDLVNAGTLLNGVAHGGTMFPNNRGDHPFGAGPYDVGGGDGQNLVVGGNFNYYSIEQDIFNYIVNAPEALAIAEALAIGDVSLASDLDQSQFGSFYDWDGGTQFITINSNLDYDSTNTLNLLATGDVSFNASVQNRNLTGGDINVVAGWDGTTPFDATTFLAADVNTTTLFGNNDGSIFIGSSTQTTGVAVGSRHGDTNVFSHDLTLRGSDTNLAYAQLGFHDVTGQGLETGSVITTGDINAALTGRLDAQAGSSPGFIRDTAQTSSYVQLGHGGNRTESQRFLSLFNYTGNVTLSVKEDINFTAGNANSVYSQLGHGGSTARGSHSGLITITQANDLTFKAGNGLNAYSQLGHGGVAAGEFRDPEEFIPGSSRSRRPMTSRSWLEMAIMPTASWGMGEGMPEEVVPG